jgi:hypothetical protein
VQIVRDYNRRIARYTELAMPGTISADSLASKLIKRTGSSPTRPGTASPPARTSSAADDGTPKTFAEVPGNGTQNNWTGKRDDAVKPASGTDSSVHRERSLLVPH